MSLGLNDLSGHHLFSGFMQSNELKVIEDIQTSHNKYFVPLVWATSLVTRARKEGRIKDDFAVKTLIDVSHVSTIYLLMCFEENKKCICVRLIDWFFYLPEWRVPREAMFI